MDAHGDVDSRFSQSFFYVHDKAIFLFYGQMLDVRYILYSHISFGLPPPSQLSLHCKTSCWEFYCWGCRRLRMVYQKIKFLLTSNGMHIFFPVLYHNRKKPCAQCSLFADFMMRYETWNDAMVGGEDRSKIYLLEFLGYTMWTKICWKEHRFLCVRNKKVQRWKTMLQKYRYSLIHNPYSIQMSIIISIPIRL